MVLLRSLGALAEVEAGGLRHRPAIAAGSNLPPAQSPQSVAMAERQRQPTAAGRRTDLSRRGVRVVLAESGYFVRHRPRYLGHRREWGKNDRTLRIRGPGVLVAG